MSFSMLIYMMGGFAVLSLITGWFHRPKPDRASGPVASPDTSRRADRADRERRRQLHELAELRLPF
jgi:hypothetical protein